MYWFHPSLQVLSEGAHTLGFLFEKHVPATHEGKHDEGATKRLVILIVRFCASPLGEGEDLDEKHPEEYEERKP